ncbi:MAG: hypothetical protein FJ242_02805 [Nitrospira sp.]|nr:hypothetical protein [Nitrospira sp.]
MKESKEKASCPFCGKMIDIPQKMRTELGDIIGGKCACGVVYVFDHSGHNMGQAFVDALNFACEGKCDNPWELIPGEDYEEALLHYEWRTHSFLTKRSRIPDNMCFVLLKKENK